MIAGNTSSYSTFDSEQRTWTDDLPPCPLTGIGSCPSQIYREDGQRREARPNEDRVYRFRIDDSFCLYGVFDGHEGSRVAEFASQKMPAEILLGQLKESSTPNEVKDVLRQAFNLIERGFFESLDDVLAQRADTQNKIPEGFSYYDVLVQFPETMAKLSELNRCVNCGSTALVTLLFKDRLYVAGVGNSRALLCRTDDYGQLLVQEVFPRHDLENDEELIRLTDLALEAESARTGLRLLSQGNTRCLGNYLVKGGYKESEYLSKASSEPVTPEPTIPEPIEIDESCRFLILMTDALFRTAAEVSCAEDLNLEIAQLTIEQFNKQSTITGVAQSVVDQIVRLHHERFLALDPRARTFNGHDDLTFLIRNFSYPMGNNAVGNFALCTMDSLNSSRDYFASPLSSTSSQASVVVKGVDSSDLSYSCETLTQLATSSSTESSDLPQRRESRLPLDSEGKVAAYVDFSVYFKSVGEAREKGLLSKGIDY